jgi:hypothetical protein
MDRGLSGDVRVDTVFICIETVIEKTVLTPALEIKDDQNFTPGVVRRI